MARHTTTAGNTEPDSSGAAKVEIVRSDGTHVTVEGEAGFVAKETAAILDHLYPAPPPPPAA